MKLENVLRSSPIERPAPARWEIPADASGRDGFLMVEPRPLELPGRTATVALTWTVEDGLDYELSGIELDRVSSADLSRALDEVMSEAGDPLTAWKYLTGNYSR